MRHTLPGLRGVDAGPVGVSTTLNSCPLTSASKWAINISLSIGQCRASSYCQSAPTRTKQSPAVPPPPTCQIPGIGLPHTSAQQPARHRRSDLGRVMPVISSVSRLLSDSSASKMVGEKRIPAHRYPQRSLSHASGRIQLLDVPARYPGDVESCKKLLIPSRDRTN